VFPEFKAQPWAYWHTGLIIMDKEQTFSGGIPAVQLQVCVAAAPTDIALIGRGQFGFLAAGFSVLGSTFMRPYSSATNFHSSA